MRRVGFALLAAIYYPVTGAVAIAALFGIAAAAFLAFHMVWNAFTY